MSEPEVEGYVRVEGGRLWAEWAGEGSGVVLAHAGIADARQWDPQWDALIAGHRVVRYDLRGFGRAEVEHVRFSNRADLVAVMDAAGIERAVLVGCSRAGSIVVDTALEYPGPRVGDRPRVRRDLRDGLGEHARRGGGVREGRGTRGGEGLGGARGPRGPDLGRRLRPAGRPGARRGSRGRPADGLRDQQPGEAVRRPGGARSAGGGAARRAVDAGPGDRRAARRVRDDQLRGGCSPGRRRTHA